MSEQPFTAGQLNLVGLKRSSQRIVDRLPKQLMTADEALLKALAETVLSLIAVAEKAAAAPAMYEALKAQEDLYQRGLLNVTTEEVIGVHKLCRAALSQAEASKKEGDR